METPWAAASGEVKSVTLIDGQLEVVKFFPSSSVYGNGTEVPGQVVKEVYAAVEGKIKHVKTIQGVHYPAQRIPESFEFIPEGCQVHTFSSRCCERGTKGCQVHHLEANLAEDTGPTTKK